MVSKPKVCILSFSSIAWDSRVLREIDAARRQYQVEVIGFEEWTPPEGVVYHQVSKRQLTKIIRIPLSLGGHVLPALWGIRYWNTPFYRQTYDILAAGHFDLIHANDWGALPVAARAAQQTGARVLYDAHEYTPGQATQKWRGWLTLPYHIYLLQKYMRQTSAMITVSEGLQNLYKEHFGWDADVILNAPYYQQGSPKPTNPERIQLIHHGGAQPMRHLEDLLELTALLRPHFHLSLMLIPSDRAYLEQLKIRAEQIAPGRISFSPPAKPKEIVKALGSYDLGVPWLRPDCLNHLNALPNKFFDFIMAGLGIAVANLPAMARIVEKNQVGVVANGLTYQSLADRLNQLDPQKIDDFKQNSLSLARTLNAETEMEKLMGIYQRLLDQPAPN